ncbi:AB hydrolase-1 domain-containing protein [Citrus sinensis]|nr:AB hydrolase-1 domain-containing protein [Citrus sinensis]
MVNLVAAQRPLLQGLMKMAGVQPHAVEIEPGTTMNFWVPRETIEKPKKGEKIIEKEALKKPSKPVVVLVHGFAAEGIVTWQFQVGALTKKYSVYIPDLLFFGGSITDEADRSPTFQAQCLATGLAKLGVDKCVLVGFSYGGMVSFKVAELYPNLVQAMVVSGSILAMTDSINETNLNRLGVSSSSELLLPNSVKGLKALLSVATYKKLWFPSCLYKDFLERVHLLWGEDDQIFNVELAHNMKEQLGADHVTFQGIKKAGHLVHLERPCAYNRCLKQFLASLHADGQFTPS